MSENNLFVYLRWSTQKQRDKDVNNKPDDNNNFFDVDTDETQYDDKNVDKTDGSKYVNYSQYNICNNYCLTHFPNIKPKFISEIGSSYNNNKNLAKLKDLISKGKNKTIIISDVSRFGRNRDQIYNDLNIVKSKNHKIISVTDNCFFGNEDQCRSIEFEKKSLDAIQFSNMLSMKTKLINETKRKQGQYVGRPPFGKKIRNGYLVDNDEELVVIRQIEESLLDGEAIDNIITRFNCNKILGRKNWKKSTIKGIINKNNPDLLQHIKENQEIIDEIDKMDITCSYKTYWKKN